MTKAADHVILDTNILLAATDEGRPDHHRALRVLNEWPQRGITCYTSGQILREYLVGASRPVEVNGLGMAMDDCLRNVRAFRDRLRFLDESEKVHDRLTSLLAAVPCSGKQMHDANVVAVATAHGVGSVATQNLADFSRFGEHVRVVPVE